jgi:hypothetical protein
LCVAREEMIALPGNHGHFKARQCTHTQTSDRTCSNLYERREGETDTCVYALHSLH